MKCETKVPTVEMLATELKSITDALSGHLSAGDGMLNDLVGIPELSAALFRIALDLQHINLNYRPAAKWRHEEGNVIRLALSPQ